MFTHPKPDSELPGPPIPVEVELTINGERHNLPFEKAFALGCSLLKKGQPDQASKVFEKLQRYTDRGPRAFIMRAFCEAAVRHFSECSAVLSQAFAEESREVGSLLHDAFVFYHGR
jgi:hypothetical protein